MFFSLKKELKARAKQGNPIGLTNWDLFLHAGVSVVAFGLFTLGEGPAVEVFKTPKFLPNAIFACFLLIFSAVNEPYSINNHIKLIEKRREDATHKLKTQAFDDDDSDEDDGDANTKAKGWHDARLGDPAASVQSTRGNVGGSSGGHFLQPWRQASPSAPWESAPSVEIALRDDLPAHEATTADRQRDGTGLETTLLSPANDGATFPRDCSLVFRQDYTDLHGGVPGMLSLAEAPSASCRANSSR